LAGSATKKIHYAGKQEPFYRISNVNGKIIQDRNETVFQTTDIRRFRLNEICLFVKMVQANYYDVHPYCACFHKIGAT